MSNKIPPQLVRQLGNNPMFNLDSFLRSHEDSQASSVSIRINASKPRTPQGLSEAELQRVPWCDTGFYLNKRPSFTLDPFFHAGCYYPQEASSMFLAHALQTLKLNERPIKALDLCAAPGGKSTLLASYLHQDSLLVANEIIKSRVGVLDNNLIKWGNLHSVVTNNDPVSFAKIPGYFDLMLVDAPCSGSGMLRKDHVPLDNWSESTVKLCKERQERILSNSISALKEGGILFYSTCSYSVEENEEITDFLVETHGLESLKIPINKDWNIVESCSPIHACSSYRFYPHLINGEGFFFAAFIKTGNQADYKFKKTKAEIQTVPNEQLSAWVKQPQEYYNFMVDDEVHVFPALYKDDLYALKSNLYIKNAGCCVGSFQKGSLIPDHELALSAILHPDIPKLKLELEEALNYLRKQPISPELIDIQKKGWSTACYQGIPLGWIKVIPGRANNYYPKKLRIMHL